MASIIFSNAGSALGGASGIPGGAFIGRALGRIAGGFLDSALFGSDIKLKDRASPRLADLAVQTSTYGKMIPIVYGTVRIAGNVIWSRPIEEHVTSSTSSSGGGGGGKGGGGRVSQTTTTYSYTVSLAVAVCEGAVDGILRIWADAKLLDASQYTIRTYLGGEDQEPDSFIASVEGVDDTPAYRGLAYVVIENFPLADFGNRIPNFTFEVSKKAQNPDFGGEITEDLIEGMTLIPGAGEFVYDTQVGYKVPGEEAGGDWAQSGGRVALNMHNATGEANVKLALDQLANACPNVEWVSVVVCWFGDSMDAGECVIKPGVEYQSGVTTQPEEWAVGIYTRATARQITLVEGSPRYGGTPSDASVLRLLAELSGRGYSIMFYPMLFMDVDGKPWRGQITGDAAGIDEFFNATEGYNAFVTHYANLVSGHVDAFVIGSELKGLTAVTDTPGGYPAVDELIGLAATVKAAVGSALVTYAADWSEYHHTEGGWYNLDPLWASDNIDVIGIDAYFPLSDAPQGAYDVQALIDGWTSGEGWDFYYTDEARTATAALSAPYAWKNIAWWWSNAHTNPDASATAWVPESKPIWFTEYGFPSVDGCANQPNVFFDPASVNGGLPYHSRGRIDLRAQRAAIAATLHHWSGSEMVQRMFLWTWDARPYPYFPDLGQVWADGGNWIYGHWVQGKLGTSGLSAILADLCARAGLAEGDFSVEGVTDLVEGFVIAAQQTIRKAVEQLQQGYFFDACESGGVLKFIPRGGIAAEAIAEDEIIPDTNEGYALIRSTRAQELELPKRINVVYLNRLADYQPATQYAQRETTGSRQKITVDIPVVFSGQSAKSIADATLFSAWVQRTAYALTLPMRYAALEPADIIDVTENGVTHRMRITATTLSAPGQLKIDAVAEDISAYDFYTPPGEGGGESSSPSPLSDTRLAILDIPALPGDRTDSGILRYGGRGISTPWAGAALYRSDDGGLNYERVLDLAAPAILGTAVTALSSGSTAVFDDTGSVTVTLPGGELSSASELAVLNGANAAMLGDELIQFKTATLIEPGKYTLSGLLRGRMGTEWAVATHAAGERFVLLNGLLSRQYVTPGFTGLPRLYKPVTIGGTLDATAYTQHTYTGVCMKPFAPTHICASRDGSGNISLSWVRRARAFAEWPDYVDAPLNEASEAYEVDIMNGGSVARTLTGLSTPTASYSAAAQTTDFGGTQSSLTVRVYQLSAYAGRGYKGEAVV